MAERYVGMIQFRDVRAGDTVGRFDGEEVEIWGVGESAAGESRLFIRGGTSYLGGAPDQYIGLVRRPRPDRLMPDRRMTEEDTLNMVRHYARRVAEAKEDILILLHAIAVHELGKPGEAERRDYPDDDVHPEVDASCGYLGGGSA